MVPVVECLLARARSWVQSLIPQKEKEKEREREVKKEGGKEGGKER